MKREKRLGGLMSVLGLAAAGCLALWGCPLGMMDDYHAEVKTPDGGDSFVSDYNLQAYVPVPTAGAVPVKAVDSRRDLEVSVVWKDENGGDLPKSFDAFVLDTVYQARITLTTKAGYSFDSGMSFKYYPADTVDGQPADDFSAGKRTLSLVTYKKAAAPIIIPSVVDTSVAYNEETARPEVTFTFNHAVITVTDVPATADWTITGTGTTVIKAVYTGSQYGTNQTISFTATGASGGTAASGAVTVLSVRSFPTGGSSPVEYTIKSYDPALHVAAVRKADNGVPDGFLVPDEGWQKLFNAIYTPNKPNTTDAIESGKTTIPYDETISAAALNLFKVKIGGTAHAGDRVAIKGDTLPAASGADVNKPIVIDLGLPGDVDNSGLKFIIPDRELGAADNSGDYGHIRFRVNQGADLVIEADNANYIAGGNDKSCPNGYFNYGCVEVMAGGKLRDGAYEGFPLGSHAVILNRYGSYLGVGPEAGSSDATAKAEAYADWYSGWLVGPGSSDPKIVWDNGGGTTGYLEVRPSQLAISTSMTVKKTVGLIYSVWLVGNVTVTIDAGGSNSATIMGKKGLFANGEDYKIYATSNQAKIEVKSGSALHKAFLTTGSGDLDKVIEGPRTIPNGGTGSAELYADKISGYSAWDLN